MKLSRLYSNRPAAFGPIEFRDGLNVVLGEIRRPGDRSEDTHNLGKTLLAQVVDFCLLKKKDKDFFLFRHSDRFEKFVFFLEVEVQDGGFVTIRRDVDRGSKASFKQHDVSNQDFTGTPESGWNHWDVPFKTAIKILDGLLNLTAIKPWSFRHAIAYSLRAENDYDSPFKLAKFAGQHREWKPLLAHILGLDASLVRRNYELVAEVDEKKEEEARQHADSEGIDNRDQLRGLITIRQQEIDHYQRQLDEYDFDLADAEINRELVEELDARISDLNERRYYLDSARERTEAALNECVDFDLDDIRQLFEQSKVYFGEHLEKDFGDLVAFNQAITSERNAYLDDELEGLRSELTGVRSELSELNARRSAALVVLKDREAFSKYRRLSQSLVEKKAALESLRHREAALESLATTRRRVHELTRALEEVREEIETNIEEGSGLYRMIREGFNDVISGVINKDANLYTKLNQEGNPEFHVDLVDEQGGTTSGAEGHTYGRLLCIAFDMAVQHAYVDKRYPHFVYHDGVLESLDDRKKLNLIEVIRQSASAGIQHIVTIIQSELPQLPSGRKFAFEEEEVILLLHDEDVNGRLFRMDTW